MRRQLMWAAYRPDSGESRDWPRFAGDLEGRLLPRVVLDATSRVDRFSGHGAVPARLLLSTKHSGPVEGSILLASVCAAMSSASYSKHRFAFKSFAISWFALERLVLAPSTTACAVASSFRIGAWPD